MNYESNREFVELTRGRARAMHKARSSTIRALLGPALLGAMLHAQAALADDFLTAQMPRKLALVVGNGAYESATRLPGAPLDADEMAKTLKQLGFVTRVAKDVRTRSEFLDSHFFPFVNEINEGDVVVFFYSGHGFTYAGENYLTPLRFGNQIDAVDVFTTFMSSMRLHEAIGERLPSILVMLLDACRTMKGFRIRKSTGVEETVSKGLGEFPAKYDNSIIGYSSDIGTESLGSDEEKLSVYTAAAVKYLPTGDQDFDKTKKNIRTDVRLATEKRQTPWFSESSSAEFYLNPSPKVLEQQRELWVAALSEGTRSTIQRYAMTYGTGPYGAAARRWLKLNADAPEQVAGRVSPAGPDVVWSLRDSGLRLLAFNGDLVPSAILSTAALENNDVLQLAAKAPVAGTLAGWSERRDNSIRADVLETLGRAVVLKELEARVAPRVEAITVTGLRTGQSIEITGSQKDSENNVWLKARTPTTTSDFYVLQNDANKVLDSLDIGSPTLEVLVRPAGSGISSLIDARQVKKAIIDATRGGRRVTWAAVATPVSKKGHEAIEGLRAVHLRHVLAASGIGRERQSTIEQSSIPDGVLRLRLFTEKGVTQ